VTLTRFFRIFVSIFGFGSFVRDRLLQNLRLGYFVWELSCLGTFAWGLSLWSFCLGTFALKLSRGDVRLGMFALDLSLDNFRV